MDGYSELGAGDDLSSRGSLRRRDPRTDKLVWRQRRGRNSTLPIFALHTVPTYGSIGRGNSCLR